VATIGPDQVEAGRLQGRQVRALLPSGGFILYVLGPALTASAQDRLAGLQEALDGSRVEVSQVYGNWQTGLAEEAVAEWLRVVLQTRVRLDLVVCQNDAMAVGARNVLERLAAQHPDLTRVAVTGLDGRDDVGKTLVDQGRLAATIVLPSSGAPAVEWLAKAFKGESVPRAVVLPVTSYPDLPELEKRRRAPR
jgi:ABC-type sugar transport system substrate-binding protein